MAPNPPRQLGDQTIKHIEMVQAVINRLAGNSFTLKGWNVSLVAAVVALLSGSGAGYIGYALIPAVAFWFLDGYFLWQERLFRGLHDALRRAPGFDGVAIEPFSMNPGPVRHLVKGWFAATFWKTVPVFHGALCVAVTILAVLARG